MLTIRRLERKDGFGGLIELSRAFLAEYEPYHEALFRVQTVNDQEIIEYFSRFLEKEDHAAFMALQGGEIVGYITVRVEVQPGYWKVRNIGHISGLMVRKPDRGKGIGGALLEQARAYLRERNVRYFTVYTAVANTDAIRFYRRRGLEPLHTHFVGTV